MKVTCPKCGGEIAAMDVNMASGVLFCRRCEEMFPLTVNAEDIPTPIPDGFSLDQPPAGAWHEAGFEGEEVGATCRGLGGAIFSFVFAAGFGGGGCAMIYSAVMNSNFDVGLFFFSLPFGAVGLGALIVFLLKLFGQTVAVVTPSEVRARTSLFGLNWNAAVALTDLERMQQVEAGRTNREPFYTLELTRNDGSTVKFGSLLSQARLDYLEHALRTLLKERAGIVV